jgi:hypothetical protein
VFVVCCVGKRPLRRADLSFRGVRFRVFVIVCDLETSTMRRPRSELGCKNTEKKMNGTFGKRPWS